MDEFIMNFSNSGQRDGFHPTPKGCQFIGELVFDQLAAKHLIKAGLKIVCFEDSISPGVHVEGADTSWMILMQPYYVGF